MPRKSIGSAIKVGVIGYGGAFNMGRKHLQEMEQAGMVPTAVTEIDPARLEVATSDFPGIQTYSSVAEMLKKSAVQLVSIITPHNTHAPLAIQCLKAGRHVVCEKPLAITTAECDRMMAAAEKSGVVLSTYHNRHWDGCILQAVKTIGKGTIGDIVRIDAHRGNYGQPKDWWRTSKSISGGIMYDWGVHLLEYSLQLITSPITEVTGFHSGGHWGPKTAWKDDANEDEGFLSVRFESGQWLTLRISQIDSNARPTMLDITGTKGAYNFDGRGWELITYKDNQKVVTTGQNPAGEGWRFYQNIADHLSKGETLVITPEWSRRPIHILDLADKSANAGRAMKVKYQ